MNCINKLSGILLPVLVLSTLAACGSGGGGGGTAPPPVGGPTNLDYGASGQALARSIPFGPITPTFSGTADAFAVTAGTLPVGLSIDTSTGAIAGTPTAVQAGGLVTVTASLTGGTSDAFNITFTVGTGSSRALYLANQADGLIAIYSVDPTTGKLDARGDVTGLDSPLGMVLTPDLSYFYTANTGTGTISGFAVDAGTGDLAELAGSPFPMLGGIALSPHALAVSPDGSTLYAANRVGNSISMFTISANGALSELVGSPFGTYATSRDLATANLAGGDYLYLIAAGASPNKLITLSIGITGALTEVDADTTGGTPTAIAATLAGDFVYVANQADNTVSAYAVASDGTLTELVSSPTAIAGGASFLSDIAIADNGTTRSLYTTSINGIVTQFALAANGALSLLTPDSITASGAAMFGLAVAPDGATLYACDSNIKEVDCYSVGGTGALTALLDLPRLRTAGATLAALVLPSLTTATWSTNNLYATNFSGNSVSTFDVDGTGAMTAQPTLDTATSANPEDILVGKSGQMLYLSHPGDTTAPLMTVPLSANGTPDGINATAVAGNNASFLALDKNSDFLYVLDGPGQTVRPFPLDASGNIGAPGAVGLVGLLPVDVTLDPTGRFAYVVNFQSKTVTQFTVDLITGALTPMTPPTTPTGLNPRSIVVHPSGRHAYVTAAGASGLGGDAIGQYNIDPTTGALTLMVTPQIVGGIDPGAIVASPDGRYVIVANSGASTISTYQVNSLNGNGIENGNLVGPIDTATTTTQPQTLAVSADGSTVYVGINIGTGIQAFTISATGMLTSLDSETTGGVIHSVALRESRQ